MKCPFRKHSVDYELCISGEKHHHEEFEECDAHDCPFYVKSEKRELCKRVLVEVIENNAQNYSF